VSCPPAHQPEPADLAIRILGHQGRILSYSKSGYLERLPLNVAVFNGHVATEETVLWTGDLDLTAGGEQQLIELANTLHTTVYLLPEGDWKGEQPPLVDRALYSVAPGAHSAFDYRWIERTTDGTLRRRPPDPASRKRFLLPRGRPRLWRFWTVELKHSPFKDQSALLYIGRRQYSGPLRVRGPLLVLGHHHHPERIHPGYSYRGLEWTWYPTRKRSAPRPLLHLHAGRRHRGRIRPQLYLTIHPGVIYMLIAGIEHRSRPSRDES
jgi:hypothetical protein